MPEPKFTYGGLLDSAVNNKYTLDFSVIKPAFGIGQEVEVYYYRTKCWHKAVVRGVRLAFDVFIDDKEIRAEAWRWAYVCGVRDMTIVARMLEGYQTDYNPKHQSIRARQDAAK